MKAIALVVLLSFVAQAADDAPLVTPAAVLDAKCYTADERANVAKAIVSRDARILELEANIGTPLPVLVLAIALGVVAGGAIGAGVGYALAPKK